MMNPVIRIHIGCPSMSKSKRRFKLFIERLIFALEALIDADISTEDNA